MRGPAVVAAILTVASLLGDRPHAQIASRATPSYAAPSHYLMPREEEIALAKSAAPPTISGRATIKLLTPAGFQIAREGDNGFVCLVMRGWAAPTFTPSALRDLVYDATLRAPICFDPAAARMVLPFYELKHTLGMAGRTPDQIADAIQAAYARGQLPKRESVSFGYMWSADQQLGPGIGHWHPHMMVFAPYYDNAMLGGSDPGVVPIVSDDAGTPFTVVVIPVDGTLAIKAQTGREIAAVTLDSGRVMGVAGNDPAVMVYKGMPFAAPPVGDLRWREPQPVKPWSDVKAADTFGPRCLGRFLSAGPPAAVGEDCLYLNVWTPAQPRGERLPVFVWIHGGGFQGGSGSEPVFDGEALARKGVVVVTFNYRTNVFGFLAHPELTSESKYRASGNYGLLDQVAALEWIKRNIGAFGGDPSRVTIAGESAGSYSVSALTASPLSRGLFHQAVAESGGYFMPKPDAMRALATAEKIGADFAATLGAADLAGLRRKSADEVMKAVGKMEDFFAFQPVIDGRFLRESVYTTYVHGGQAKVPVLLGSNTDEGAFLIPEQRPSVEEFEARLGKTFGARVSLVRHLYPVDTPAARIRSELDLSGDGEFNYPMWKWAVMQRQAGLPVYYYLFGRTLPAAPGQQYKGIPRAAIGALHGDEVAYVFGTLDNVARTLDGSIRKWEKTDRDLSAAMLSYWANFVTTGDPNGPGLPAWPRYDARANDPLMHLDTVPQARPDDRVLRLKTLDLAFQPASK